jgi:ABC-type hemin transport system ATPase subunit
MGRKLSPDFDQTLARSRLERVAVPLDRRVATLSVGQRAQVALTLALARRPALLLLDEPLASLDPLARREFLQALMGSVAEQGVTVVLSSHLLADPAARRGLRQLHPGRLRRATTTVNRCLVEFGPGAYNLELFHPADRFWLFQGIETALFVALAVLLLLASVHWVRRRIS